MTPTTATQEIRTLWDRPIAHAGDPLTSYQAGEQAESGGQAGRQRDVVLKAVMDFPGSTSAELARYRGWDRWMPARRLPELARQGLIERGEPRMCSVCKRRSVTWWIKR